MPVPTDKHMTYAELKEKLCSLVDCLERDHEAQGRFPKLNEYGELWRPSDFIRGPRTICITMDLRSFHMHMVRTKMHADGNNSLATFTQTVPLGISHEES